LLYSNDLHFLIDSLKGTVYIPKQLEFATEGRRSLGSLLLKASIHV